MLRKCMTLVVLSVLIAGSAPAGDLYRVALHNSDEADKLIQIGADPIHGRSNVYVVLVDSSSARLLAGSGLDAELLADNVTREQLAIDSRRDRVNVDRFELLFEQSGYRLYRVDPGVFTSAPGAPPVYPLLDIRPRIEYQPARTLEEITTGEIVDGLDTIIAQVCEDSLRSYVLSLQSFQTRVMGTASNYASRDWIISKLQSFGYDSVVTDSFYGEMHDEDLPCQNVLAYKIGATFPNLHVIVGAHRDAVPGSPGADDNASGAAGVLEFARILKDINTDLTFVFCLFDAEEFGLLGSYHYMNTALIEQEEIPFMLNMDMIASIENTDQANLYYGDDDTFARLWGQLADSLVGITGHFVGDQPGSDHYPFGLAGIPVVFPAEYIFSCVFHTYQDSTTYMSFPYMTKMVKASLATAYQANVMLKPPPAIAFVHLDEFPTMVSPGYSTFFVFGIDELNLGTLVPGSASLYCSVDGAPYQSETLTDLGDNRFRAVLPPVSCYGTLKYYVSAEEIETGLYLDGSPEHPYWATAATDYAPTFEDDFEADEGWSSSWEHALAGFWVRGVPVEDPYSSWGPTTDASGQEGICFVTGNHVREDVDEGIVRLWSPRFELPQGASISYDYFLSLSLEDGIDRMVVEITPEYAVVPWMTAAVHNTDGGGFWRHNVITWQELETAGMTPSSHARVRFAVNDDDPQSTVEAGVDNFSVGNYDCGFVPCCGGFTGGFTGNTDCDAQGAMNLTDVTALIDRIYLSKRPLCCEANGNVNGDSENLLNLSDVTALIDHIYLSKNPTAACQ